MSVQGLRLHSIVRSISSRVVRPSSPASSRAGYEPSLGDAELVRRASSIMANTISGSSADKFELDPLWQNLDW